MMASRTRLGFTTKGHTGEDVFLYAYGPQKPAGLVENTELSQYVIKYLGLEPLSKITEKRFIPAKEHYEKLGYKTKIEHAVFIAEKDGEKMEFPAHQNVKIINGEPFTQKGINVYNDHSFWVPSQ